jgi:leucyl/phenylalanyl-tRNA--protein transferase
LAYHADHIGLIPADAALAQRRAALFRESLADKAERWALGTVYALTPKRIAGLPGLGKLWFEELLAPDYALPNPERALASPAGLAGIVHDFTQPTIIAAYRRGLYPWAHIGPLKWWSAPDRSVLFFDEFHFSKNQRKLMRQDRYTVTFDRDFEAVIAGCAGHRQDRWHVTWITPRIMRAYAEAFDAGHVHSYEVWNEKGELAGGGYGLSIGGAFFAESQYSREPNTSKIALTVLNFHLARWGYHFNDGKLMNPTSRDMGFRNIPRQSFLTRLSEAVRVPGKTGRWQVEADLKTVSHWQPEADAGA